MRIAIVGTGIAGNVVAYKLHRRHDITVFEAGSHVGGHTHTHDIIENGTTHTIDTGFIVFNDWTYPNFIALLDELGVESTATAMSFSSSCRATGIEYCGSSLNTLFAQRRNLLRPGFHGMIRDILRFNRDSRELLESEDTGLSLGQYLVAGNYGRLFINNYIIPMGAAIWSTDPQLMLSFPAVNFVRFFYNHGLLNIKDRPQWRVIKGGSREYVKKLTAGFCDRIRLNTPVISVERTPANVIIQTAAGTSERFDHVFIASHSDQALDMLADATQAERDILGAIPYQRNEVALHTDTGLLPRTRRAWAAWNYLNRSSQATRVSVTYNMNILQHIKSSSTYCVTLNDTENIAPDRIIQRLAYHHPVFTASGITAQQRQNEINGVQRTWYCGAYWRNGFHEDGVYSALQAVKQFEELTGHAQSPLRRAG